MEKRFELVVITKQNIILRYVLDEFDYSIEDGMVSFEDPKTRLLKKFPTDWCEFTEVRQ